MKEPQRDQGLSGFRNNKGMCKRAGEGDETQLSEPTETLGALCCFNLITCGVHTTKMRSLTLCVKLGEAEGGEVCGTDALGHVLSRRHPFLRLFPQRCAVPTCPSGTQDGAERGWAGLPTGPGSLGQPAAPVPTASSGTSATHSLATSPGRTVASRRQKTCPFLPQESCPAPPRPPSPALPGHFSPSISA